MLGRRVVETPDILDRWSVPPQTMFRHCCAHSIPCAEGSFCWAFRSGCIVAESARLRPTGLSGSTATVRDSVFSPRMNGGSVSAGLTSADNSCNQWHSTDDTEVKIGPRLHFGTATPSPIHSWRKWVSSRLNLLTMLTAKVAGSRGPCGRICVWPILRGRRGKGSKVHSSPYFQGFRGKIIRCKLF